MDATSEVSGTEIGARTSPSPAPSWNGHLVTVAVGLAALLAIYWPTAASFLHQWNNSTAYNYGYLIAPISIYLLWTQRRAIAVWQPSPSPVGAIPALAFAMLWLLSDLLGIDEGRQIALVGMMQALFLTVLGWPLYWRLIFPLSYLWLMVPTGEFVVPFLQILSHAVAVEMLELSGMSVYAEGILIQVPSGNFIVEPGCAGLNFLLASIALALLYGKLTYRKTSARVICLVVSIVASILANFMRVYLIVAITEWTDRKINIADDHLFYGWVFFGIVMLVLMSWGMKFRDVPDDEPSPADERPAAAAVAHPAKGYAFASAILLVGAAPTVLSHSTIAAPGDVAARFALPPAIGDWARRGVVPDWSPDVRSSGETAIARYGRANETVDVGVIYFRSQRDGYEAAHAFNAPATDDWSISNQGTRQIEIGDRTATVGATVLKTPIASRAVFWWYQSSGCTTVSRLTAKLCAARERIAGRPSDGAYYVISAPFVTNPEPGFAALTSFAQSLRMDEVTPSAAQGAAR